MTEYQVLDDGNAEAQDLLGMSFLFAQSQAGKVVTGVLNGLGTAQTTTASASVLVGIGSCVTQASVAAGVQQLVNNTTKTLDVLGANPMGATPRNDLVVFDPGTKSIRLVVGTPNAAPSDPALPANAVALSRIRNAASATTVPTSAIDDLRSFTSLFGVSPSAPFAQAAGAQNGFSASSHVSGGAVQAAVTFPAGRFTVAPIVTVNMSTAPGGSGFLVARATNITTTGCSIVLYNVSASTTSYSGVNVGWEAVQMTPTSASG